MNDPTRNALDHEPNGPEPNGAAPGRAARLGGRPARTAVLLAGALLAACGGGSSGESGASGPGAGGSALGLKPGAGGIAGGGAYLTDPNGQGNAQSLELIEIRWGRLVDVTDEDGDQVFRDLLIDASVDDALGPDGQPKWELSTNPVTGRQLLQVFADAQTETELFTFFVQQTLQGLQAVDPKGIGPGVLPPFTVLPRNCAISLRFNDLLDEDTIELNDTVRILTGSPATVPFEARVFGDPNFGGIAALDGQFHSSRIVIDFTVSEFDLSTIDDLVAVNGIGLPPSDDTAVPNVLLRLPTRTAPSFGQFDVLQNVRGQELDPSINEPIDLNSPSVDVVRAMRAGTPDEPNNGFLVDQDRPQVIGVQPVTVFAADPIAATVDDPRDFVVDFSFAIPSCVSNLFEGDVLEFADQLRLEVLENTAIGPNQTAFDVPVRIPLGIEPIGLFDEGDDEAEQLAKLLDRVAELNINSEAAQLLNVFRLGPSGQPLVPPSCFVRFSPNAQAPPNASVDPAASIIVRFSEPLDPLTVRPFDTLYVARTALVNAALSEGPTAPQPGDLIPATIIPTPDFTEFRFQPTVPFTHAAGSQEAFFLSMFSTVDSGIVDLAGNGVLAPLPRIEFRMDSAAATTETGGWVLRFNANNEDQNPGPEIRGQIVFDTINGRVRPRPVQRFPAVLDRSQPLVGDMQPITTGLQTPLASAGSKAHLTWRYTDVGYGISQKDGTFYDLDIEGMSLSPLGGQVTATFYEEFELRVEHGARVPDEAINPGNFNPNHPNSGFRPGGSYAQSFLPGQTADIVHPRDLGFTVSNADVFVATSGTPMLPMPWNRGLPEDEKTFFTWRDTSLTTLGALNDDGSLIGAGVPLEQEVAVVGLTAAPGSAYGPAATSILVNPTFGGLVQRSAGVPTIGLPLISEFRCYPTEQPSLNNFDVSIAISSCNRPFFRAFSTGGVNTGGQTVIKDPDQEIEPDGGFNGNPQIGPIGQSTNGRDPTVYMGQLDVVLRISRAHTALIDAEQQYDLQTAGGLYDYSTPVVEPAPADQPTGTSVVLAYRGHEDGVLLAGPGLGVGDIDGDGAADDDNNVEWVTNASLLDVYGNVAYGPLQGTTSNARLWDFTQPEWSESIDDVDGLRFLQTRFTFVSNTASLVSPVLDSYAVAFNNSADPN